MVAIKPHQTETVDTPWDAAETVKRVRSPESPEYFARIFAWRDDEANEEVKSSYSFPHHEVNAEGEPGPANTRACSAGIAVLNGARGGTKIPEADREGVWRHLAAHLRDAEREPPDLRPAEAELESKTFDVRLEQAQAEGVLRGIASMYDTPDLQGDVISRGAFTNSVKERPEVPLLWQHDQKAVIGIARLAETERGLEIEAQLDMDDPDAQRVYEKVRKNLITGLSIGYQVLDAEWTKDGDRAVRQLREVAVWEVSVVTIPALPSARITEVRAVHTVKTEEKKMELNDIRETLRTEIDEKVTGLKHFVSEQLAEVKRKDVAPSPVSIGAKVATDERVIELAKSSRQGGVRIEVGRFDFETKQGPVSRPVATFPTDVLPIVIDRMTKRRRLRQFLPVATMRSAAIQFLRQTNVTEAGVVAELDAKKLSQPTYEVVTVVARTLAHYIKVPKQFLSDVEALQERIENELLEGLADHEDYQLMQGDGTGQNLRGLLLEAPAATGQYTPANPNALELIGGAMAELEAAGFTPDLIVMHPGRWRALTMEKTNLGYLLGSPAEATEKRLWGIPVFDTAFIPANKAIVAQVAGTVALYDREESSIQVTNTDADDFVRNRVTILAEERIALAVYKPQALLEVTFS